MTHFNIEPDWNSSKELQEIYTSVMARGRRTPWEYSLGEDNRRVAFQQLVNETGVVHILEGLPLEIDPFWSTLPLASLRIVNTNSPVTNAFDGEYRELLSLAAGMTVTIRARVERYMKQGTMQQYIAVKLSFENPHHTLVPVNEAFMVLKDWYDALRAGEKDDSVRVKVMTPAQPAIPSVTK